MSKEALAWRRLVMFAARNAGALLVLEELCVQARHGEVLVNVNISAIARIFGIERKAVQRGLQALAEDGFIGRNGPSARLNIHSFGIEEATQLVASRRSHLRSKSGLLGNRVGQNDPPPMGQNDPLPMGQNDPLPWVKMTQKLGQNDPPYTDRKKQSRASAPARGEDFCPVFRSDAEGWLWKELRHLQGAERLAQFHQVVRRAEGMKQARNLPDWVKTEQNRLFYALKHPEIDAAE